MKGEIGKINNVAKSFNIESADVNDNPLNIYKV